MTFGVRMDMTELVDLRVYFNIYFGVRMDMTEFVGFKSIF